MSLFLPFLFSIQLFPITYFSAFKTHDFKGGSSYYLKLTLCENYSNHDTHREMYTIKNRKGIDYSI